MLLKCIKENKDQVILLAKTLLKHEQITGDEIDYLLANGHLKRDEVPEEKPEETPKDEPKEVSKEADKTDEVK